MKYRRGKNAPAIGDSWIEPSICCRWPCFAAATGANEACIDTCRAANANQCWGAAAACCAQVAPTATGNEVAGGRLTMYVGDSARPVDH